MSNENGKKGSFEIREKFYLNGDRGRHPLFPRVTGILGGQAAKAQGYGLQYGGNLPALEPARASKGEI